MGETKERWEGLSRKAWLVLFLYFTATGLLKFGYKYLDEFARGRTEPAMVPFLEEMTGVYAGLALLPLVIPLARRFPFRRGRWLKPLGAHFLIATGFSLADTTLMAVSRNFVFPLLGQGAYDYGAMSWRYPMEYCNHLLGYSILVSVVFLFDQYRDSQRRQIATARLESKLAQAQLGNLRLQLQPHFLFNALNTISTVMYEDARAADEMIARLSDLLRLTLASSQAQEVPLADELEILDRYIQIMRARFEDRLTVSVDVERGAETALVPQLILQPLVENSIRHGVDPATSTVRVSVQARRENGSLRLEVRDRGPGIEGGREAAMGKGIGLTNTAERLGHLYGAGQRLDIGNDPEGGLVVTVELPFHTVPAGV